MSISKEIAGQTKVVSLARPQSLSLDALKPILPALLLAALVIIFQTLPNAQPLEDTAKFLFLALVASGLYLAWWIASYFIQSQQEKLYHVLPKLIAGLVLLNLWELLTLKFNVFPLPYFPSASKVVSVLFSDWKLLGISTLYSLRLLALGYGIGVLAGIPTGIAMGWYQRANYWLNPILRVIGPIPSTAWIPIAMVIFPTSFTASVFLIALGTWFPVTVMTWSGIANVNKSYFEVARTLGGSEWYLIRRVALPAALPLIFIGLFMGLGVSFVTLVVGEMLGVKAGLGWYIQWAQGWAEYAKVYASLLVMALLFSGIITLVFRLRDRILVWQKGLIKW